MRWRHKWIITKIAKKVHINTTVNEYYPFNKIIKEDEDVINIECICEKCGFARHWNYGGCVAAGTSGYSWYNGISSEKRLKKWDEFGYIVDEVISYDDVMKKDNEINYCPLCGADIHRQQDCGCGFKKNTKQKKEKT